MAQHAQTQDEGALAREALAHTTKAHVTATHEPGTMDITRQQQTFVTFMRFVTRMVILIAVILIFMALVNG
jgi:hypothetical protein